MKRPSPTENRSQQDAGHQKSVTEAPRVPTPTRGEIFDFDVSSSSAMNHSPSPKHWHKGWFFVAFAAAFCIFSLGVFVRGKSKAPAPIGPFVDPPNASAALKVQVVGQVKNPGLYEVPTGARVQDAIDAAGGALPDADLRGLNLADWAKDGSQIEVPAQGAAAPVVPIVSPAPAVPSTLPNSNPPTVAAPPLPNSVPATAPSSGESVNASVDYLKQNPIDLNQASAAQLEVLPGVGPKMAVRIVEYRSQIGRFSSVSQLDNVEGIGEKRLAILRELVVVR